MEAMKSWSTKSSSLVLHAHAAARRPPLAAVGRDGGALDVAGVGDRDDHVLVARSGPRRESLDRVDGSRCGAGRRARRGSSSARRPRSRPRARGLARMSLEVGDERPELRELVDDLLALEAGEALEPQLEDRVGLDLAAGRTAAMRPVFGLRAASAAPRIRAMTCVEVVEGDDVALEDVGPGLRLAQLVGGAPAHHVAAEVDEQLADLQQVQDLRAAGRRWPA